MNVFIFAIGGTGSRVLRSLAYCLASGMECVPAGTNFVPMIIDYDKTNGDKLRTIKLLDTYRNIRKAGYEGIQLQPNDHSFFQPVINYLSRATPVGTGAAVDLGDTYEFKFGIQDGKQAGTFADYMDYEGMIGPLAATRDFLSSLYNDEDTTSSMTELHLDLEKGFKGNPNIGSIVFEGIKNDPEFQQFRCTFNPATDRVFIISSIFGGTGSSGFPRIVDAIRYSGIAGYDQALIGASIVMPYFKVNTPEGGAIHSNIFNSKQKAALSYYGTPDENGRTLFQKVTTSYFIGEDNPTTFEYSEGNEGQKNDAHIIELLAALSIIDFACTDADTLRQQHQKEYGLDSDPAATESIQMKHFCAGDRKKYFDCITRMALAFRYYEDYVLTGDIPLKTAYYSEKGLALDGVLNEGMYKDLKYFIEDFDEWLDEMATQVDAFQPFLHKPRAKNDNTLEAADLGDYVNGYEASAGGLFSSGSSYKDFSGYCNKHFNEYRNEPNDDFIFLNILYDSAYDCWKHYSLTN